MLVERMELERLGVEWRRRQGFSEGEEGKTEETRPKWEWRWVLGMG